MNRHLDQIADRAREKAAAAGRRQCAAGWAAVAIGLALFVTAVLLGGVR